MKKILAVILLWFVFSTECYAETEVKTQAEDTGINISTFVQKAKEYSGDLLAGTDMEELLNSAMQGKVDNKSLLQKIFQSLGNEVKQSITTLGSIIIIVLIHSILKSISESLENKEVAQITYYVQYILIATLIMGNFSTVIQMITESVQNMVGFTQTLVPLLMTLLLATGSIASASMLQPILLFIIQFIANLFQGVLVPFVLVSTALSIVSKISDKVQIDKIAKFMKSSTVWIMGIILTIFVGVVSLEGTLSSGVDGLTAKATKAAVSNFIPVVGKILGDAVDSVMGASAILKNAVGIVGVLIILSICLVPIIKLAVLTIAYHLVAALCQPIADGKIVSLLEQIGGTFKILLAILCSISVMMIIGITLVIKISNSGLMYR